MALFVGVNNIKNISIDVFPDLNKPKVTLLTETPGLAPEEVESMVIIPIENAINGATGVDRLVSVSSLGYGIINAEFDWDTDVFKARQITNERIAQVQSSLPIGTQIMMAPISSIMGEVVLIGMNSSTDDISSMELRTLAETKIKKRLLSVLGVANVSVIGGDMKQYQIELDPLQMQLLGVSIDEVYSAIENAGLNGTGGFLLTSYTEKLIRTIARPENISDLKHIVIKPNQQRTDAPAITLAQIADVKIAPQTFKRGDAGINGKQGVLISISKQPNIDTISLTKKLEAEIDSIEKSLPKGIILEKDIFKQSRFIQNSINNILEALLEGSIFVTIVLFVFLLNFRGTAIILTVIPCSLIMTFLVFSYFGLNINTMTLGGIAMALGSIVDDSIVDLSNIFKRLKENKQAKEPKPILIVVYEASKEVRNSIVFSTVLIFLVFIPLFALNGIEGKIFTPLALAFILSMISSMIVALTLTPVLCSYLLPKVKSLGSEKDTFVVAILKKGHKSCLNLFFNNINKVLLSVIAIFIGAILCFISFGKEFLPPFNEGNFNIAIASPAGTNFEESSRIGLMAEQALHQIPEIVATGRKQGRAELDEHALGLNVHEIEVRLSPDLKRSKDEIVADIREKLNFPGVVINIGQPISHRIDFIISGIQAQIVIKIFGSSSELINKVTDEVEAIMKSDSSLVDVARDMQIQIPQIKIIFDKEKASRHGIQLKTAVNAVSSAYTGHIVSQIMEDEFLYDVVLKFKGDKNPNINEIKNIPIQNVNGNLISLGSVANIIEIKGQNEIVRENTTKRSVVQANIKNRDHEAVINNLKHAFNEKIKLPQGVFIQIDGQFKAQQEASRNILFLSISSFLLMYVALYMNYKNINIATQLMIGIPLSVIGGILGIFISSKTISIAAIIGFIALVGIGIRNGILLMDLYTEEDCKNKTKFDIDMIIKLTQERLEPVMMTTLTSIIGFVPLLIGGNTTGKEILYPVAVVISCGLLVTAILNLLISPLLYYKFRPK